MNSKHWTWFLTMIRMRHKSEHCPDTKNIAILAEGKLFPLPL